MKKVIPVRVSAVVLAVSLLVGSAAPASAQTCEKSTTNEALQYLLRLSLDLRGRTPDLEELQSVARTGEVARSTVDGILASEELVERTRAMHRDLLWTNIGDQRLTNNAWRLRGPGRRGAEMIPAYYLGAAARMTRYRGAVTGCLDEPARIDPTTHAILTTPDPNDASIHREGWVMVAPYWDPGRPVKVCAFDAQDALTVTDGQGRTVECGTAATNARCGCGPELRWCESLPDGTRQVVLESLNEQLLRFVDDIVRTGRPYTDLLLGKDMEVNGPISHWLRYQSQLGGGDSIISGPNQNFPVPELAFGEREQWVKVQRGERHAGVLTMAGYLLKFQSDRGRANRFYNAFLCQQFQASSPLPPATDPCHAEPDLTKRCGCKDCHVAVEPAAAHWGRWAEAGLLPLNEDRFPTSNPCCGATSGTCTAEQRRTFTSAVCARFYLTPDELSGPDDPRAPFVGMLDGYVFADETRRAHVEVGPEGIARAAIDSGQFAQCTVRRMWTQLLARAPTEEEQATLDELTASFQRTYDLKQLIADLVTRPEYVEAGLYARTVPAGPAR